MNTTNPHTFIQYLNKNGNIKTVEVDREVEGTDIIFTVPPINEDFFILSLFDNNKRVLGLTFANIQNLDNIGFLNSDFQSVDAIPEIAFINANTEVAIVKDVQEYDINFTVKPVELQKTNELIFLESWILKEYETLTGFEIIPINFSVLDSPLSPNVNYFYFAKVSNTNVSLTNRMNTSINIQNVDNSNYLFFTDIANPTEIPFSVIGYKVISPYDLFYLGGE